MGWSTNAQTDSLSTKFREDQFYISFALQLQQENISGFKQNGFSNNFQIGFVRDIPLNTRGTFALGLGLGYEYNQLISNLSLETEENNTFFKLRDNQKNIQTFSSLVFPLSFRFRTATPVRIDFWRVYGGLKYKLNFGAKFNPFYGSSFQNDYIRENNTAAFLSMGYNTWNLLLEYDLNSIFKSKSQLSSGDYPELQTLKLGLIFFIL
tara:strand:- start:678 stop:1301 length:624 start_codon:yes stop_codon:yes gene_type:complete